jgi:predicted transposase/invertase (TIGR01784 family)
MDLLDPKNDYVFKRLFADSPELLAALISAVRHDEPPVEVLQVLNPQILPQDLTGKAIELDVLARDARGRLFNVEVQVQRFPRWSARSAFYLSRLLASHAYSTPSRTPFHSDGGQHSAVMADTVPR